MQPFPQMKFLHVLVIGMIFFSNIRFLWESLRVSWLTHCRILFLKVFPLVYKEPIDNNQYEFKVFITFEIHPQLT